MRHRLAVIRRVWRAAEFALPSAADEAQSRGRLGADEKLRGPSSRWSSASSTALLRCKTFSQRAAKIADLLIAAAAESAGLVVLCAAEQGSAHGTPNP